MTLPSEQQLQKLQFYVTTGYSCGYLPNKLAQSLIAAPQHLVNANVYSGLIQQGFRRSGKFAYRPHCETCRECVPVRIVIEAFMPNRSPKRAFKPHPHLTANILPVDFHEDHFALYMQYQRARHDDGIKVDASADDESEIEQYRNFLCQTNVESVLVEFRDQNKDQNKLVMVSVIDIVRDGISAVYTFYDTSPPTNDKRPSYGTYNVVWQAMWAKSLKLPYLYLGYWIKDSPKMAYKQNFKPLEKLMDGEWIKG